MRPSSSAAAHRDPSRRAKVFATRLGLVVLGAVLAYPLTARSKGQWCNDTEEGRRVNLTLESATVDGAPLELPADPNHHLATEFVDEPNQFHAVVAEPAGGMRVLHVMRAP